MLALPGATAELTGPGRGRWGRALTTVALAVTVCVGTAFTGLTPAHAGPYPSSTIPVGGRPTWVAFSPDGTQAYATTTVSSDGGYSRQGEVSVIKVATGTVSSTIPVSGSPTAVAFSPDGTQAYVIEDDGVFVIKVATGTVSSQIELAGSPVGVAFSPDGTQAYVTGTAPRFSDAGDDTGFVSVIKVATGTVSSTINLDGPTSGVAFSPDGTQAYVTHTVRSDGNSARPGAVSVIKVATGTVSSLIELAGSPGGVAFSPDGAQAYVTAARFVSVIKVATGTVSSTIPVGSQPSGVAFSPDGTQAYVTDYQSNFVSVIKVATGTVSSTIDLDGPTFAVAFSPDGTRAYIADAGGVSVIKVLVPLVSMRVIPSSASVQAGTAVRLTAEGYGSETQNSSSDLGPMNAIYTTDGNGVVSGSTVTFTKAGPHTITASYAEVTAAATVLVTPAAMASISISPSRMTVGIGDAVVFTTTGADRFGNPFDVTSKSVFASDSQTDLVRGNTVYFGVQLGKRDITGTAGVFTATAVINGQIVRPGVLPPPPARAPRRSTTKATAR